MTQSGIALPSADPPNADASLAWRGWDEGHAEARARGVPGFCLAEPAWSSGAQRLARVLAEDAGTRALLDEAFVPIRVDPVERPDLAARLRWTAVATTGTAGPPLIVLSTPGGLPFLGYCTLWPEGKDAYPSLRSLLLSVADLARERPGDLEDDAAALAARAVADAADGARPPSGAWASIRDAADPSFGGLRELPKLPRAPLLWRLLDEAERAEGGADGGADGGAVGDGLDAHLKRTLDGLRRGGVRDLLDGSFHRCGRDPRWVVPHFEKLVPVNAALAAVYARAARRFGRPEFEETARGAADFALAGLDTSTMVVAADAAYYTWTPPSVHELLDAGQVQAVGLHVQLTSDGSPHVLFEARGLDQMAETSDEAVAVLRERLEGGLRRMRHARTLRPAPSREDVAAPAWHATTLRWLFEATGHGLSVDGARLARHLERVLAEPADAARGYARGDAYWLEDQVAVAAACVAAAHADRGPLATAVRLADVILDAYVDPRSGTLSDAPVDVGRAPDPSLDVVDVDVDAAVPAAIALLRTLAVRAGTARFAVAADELVQRHAGAFAAVAAVPVAASSGS